MRAIPLYPDPAVMVCFNCQTPIHMPIPIPILIQMANIVMCKTVSTEPILIPIRMQMGTVPNLTLILVPIRYFIK